MLWIALHLPLLSLESFAATLPDAARERSLALTDAHVIVSANAPARALGVKPGLKRATALALAPQLTLGQADPARDAQALVAVTHVALAFTPAVSIQPPSDADPSTPTHTVLLEVHASLRYFGGLAGLLARLHTALAPLGHRLHSVGAATALGAALLARVHSRLDCADLAATRRALAAVPVWLLGPGRIHWDALQGMGLHTLGDLGSVPRDGLARRFGEVVLNELDRALGMRPDPREPLVPASTFDSRIELHARADTAEQLLHGAAVLLARLVAWLAAQQARVRRYVLVLSHERRSRHDDPAATQLEIGLAEPSREAAHLLALLHERLVQLQLPAPTLELRLRAHDIVRGAPPNNELFPTSASEQEGLTRLIERLQARLGPEQVLRLAPLQDHRPERASRWRAADARMSRPARTRPLRAQAASSALPAARPVWLLMQPEPLQEHANGPWLDARPLQLLSGPERIETGWWDAALAERDYFIAQSPDGALVWIYRARVPAAGSGQGWFLQGRFG